MAAAHLELQGHLRQALDGNLVVLLNRVVLADLEVLAVDAAQIAVAEEDVSGALRPGQAGLLAEVGRVGRDDWIGAGGAGSEHTRQAVVPAVPRTDRAGREQRVELLDSLFELSGLQESHIAGLVHRAKA